MSRRDYEKGWKAGWDFAVEFFAPANPTHPCATPGCPGDARYAAPGRGHAKGCRFPLGNQPTVSCEPGCRHRCPACRMGLVTHLECDPRCEVRQPTESVTYADVLEAVAKVESKPTD